MHGGGERDDAHERERVRVLARTRAQETPDVEPLDEGGGEGKTDGKDSDSDFEPPAPDNDSGEDVEEAEDFGVLRGEADAEKVRKANEKARERLMSVVSSKIGRSKCAQSNPPL